MKDLYGNTGLDPDPEVRKELMKKAKKVIWRKKNHSWQQICHREMQGKLLSHAGQIWGRDVSKLPPLLKQWQAK